MFPRFSPFNPMDVAFALASNFTMSTGICLFHVQRGGEIGAGLQSAT